MNKQELIKELESIAREKGTFACFAFEKPIERNGIVFNHIYEGGFGDIPPAVGKLFFTINNWQNRYGEIQVLAEDLTEDELQNILNGTKKIARMVKEKNNYE